MDAPVTDVSFQTRPNQTDAAITLNGMATTIVITKALMPTYDFKSLNDKEFEALSVDLLSAELAVRIERFKPGKDRGVDGRWFATQGEETVLQCKHWIGSGYKSLLRQLERSERPKLDRLNCPRYILVTSVPLSRLNKGEIATVLAPYVLSESDVFGSEDLNDLLGRHPVVERRHYKLWLSSSTVLSVLLNNAIVGRSRAELEQIRDEAPLYVKTTDHARASEHLHERRVILLTGEPGIGKTTLARQLVLEHVADGWEFVVLEENISEAESVFSEEAQQLFYFDDFLGRTFLEAIKARQDSHVLRFIKRIARDPTKRFILTSRTNILNQGAVLSDYFTDVRIVKSTYELKIGALDTMDRARILYNHIWHSALEPEYIDQLYANKRYHTIIDHKNYNPRLVAFVVDDDKVSGLPPCDYWQYVLETFNNPKSVWSHFFDAQLSQDGRDLACVVVLNGGRIAEDDLKETFLQLRSQEAVNAAVTDHRFWIAVRQTAGSILNRSIGQTKDSATYTLFNPSVADYVLGRLEAAGLWEYYYRCIRTKAALLQLQQMKSQSFFGKAKYVDILRSLSRAEASREYRYDAYTLRLTRQILTEKVLRHEAQDAVIKWTASPIAGHSGLNPADYLTVFLAANGIVEENILIQRATELPEFLENTYLPLDEPTIVANVLAKLKELGAEGAYRRLRAHIVADWKDNIDESVKEADVLGSYFDPDDTSDAEDQLNNFVMDQLAEIGVELTPGEVNELCSLVDIQDAIASNIETATRDEYESYEWREVRESPVGDIVAVDDLFDRS